MLSACVFQDRTAELRIMSAKLRATRSELHA